jgi:urease accessory protein
MGWGARWAMHTDRLTLMQWLSPAFPTGGFAYSHGLEQAIAVGGLRDAATLRDWIRDIVIHGSGRNDALLLVAGLDPDADRVGLDDIARAMAPSSERLHETMAQGAAFARTVAAITGRDLPPRPLPLAVAEAAIGIAVPPAEIAALYLHAFAANLVSVAVRFAPLGQTEGQAILASLHQPIADLAAEVAALGAGLCPDDLVARMTSCVLGADLAAMQHETMDVRIYRT